MECVLFHSNEFLMYFQLARTITGFIIIMIQLDEQDQSFKEQIQHMVPDVIFDSGSPYNDTYDYSIYNATSINEYIDLVE